MSFKCSKFEEVEASHTGKGDIQGEGSGEEARSLGVGGVRVSTCRDRGTVDFKINAQYNGLGEDVADLGFCYRSECADCIWR